MTEFLKDRHGYIIGQVDTQGGRRILKDRHGYLLGQYDPGSDRPSRWSPVLRVNPRSR